MSACKNLHGFHLHEAHSVTENGEPATTSRWTGWVWEIKWLKFKTSGKLHQSRGNYRICLKLMKKIRKMWGCNRLDLETLGSQPGMPKKLPGHWVHLIHLPRWAALLHHHSLESFSLVSSLESGVTAGGQIILSSARNCEFADRLLGVCIDCEFHFAAENGILLWISKLGWVSM